MPIFNRAERMRLLDGLGEKQARAIKEEASKAGPQPKKPRANTLVYFLACEGYVKIGYATDLASRLGGFSIGCPFEQKLLLSFRGTRDTEMQMHKRFAHLRHKGEWFRLEPDIQRFIDEHPENGIGKLRVNRHKLRIVSDT